MEPHQEETLGASSSLQTTSDRANSPEKGPSSLTQLPLTQYIVEEVPLCMPPSQLQSQQNTKEFRESDVEELFNGADELMVKRYSVGEFPDTWKSTVLLTFIV